MPEWSDVQLRRCRPAATQRIDRYLRLRLVACDLFAAGAAWSALMAITLLHRRVDAAGTFDALSITVIMTGTTALVLAAFGLYRQAVDTVRATLLSRLLWCGALIGLGGTELSRLVGLPLTVSAAGASAMSVFVALSASHTLFQNWLGQSRARGRYVRPLLLVGAWDSVHQLARIVAERPQLGYRVCGYAGPPQGTTDGPGPRRVADLVGAPTAARRLGAAALVSATGVPAPQLNALVRSLQSCEVDVYLSTGLFGMDHRRMRSLPLFHEPLVYLEPFGRSRWHQVAKRMLDVALAAVGLVLSLPVLGVAALAIKVQDGGPVLFHQVRVGRHQRPIVVTKLRTMRTGAEDEVAGLAVRNERDGPLFKVDDDPRVTRVGRLLRASSIDEIPQLWNVVRGTMSMVGPRPALVEEAAQFDPVLCRRFSVLPGVTGLWQLEARDDPSFNSYRRLDLFYVDNWTVPMDISIMISTVGSVAARAVRLMRRRGPKLPAPALFVCSEPELAGAST